MNLWMFHPCPLCIMSLHSLALLFISLQNRVTIMCPCKHITNYDLWRLRMYLWHPNFLAALHLGCIPRRASRSQRNITPSYYLSPISPDKMTITSSSLQNSVLGNHISANQFMSGYSDADKTSFSCLRMPSQIDQNEFIVTYFI